MTDSRGAVIILYGSAISVPDHADTQRINRVALGTLGSETHAKMKPTETS